MERVTGIGGVFFRSKDPEALACWYAEHLGIDAVSEEATWHQESGPTVWAPFKEDTDYFGRPDQQTMVNFRVSDLDAMLEQLRGAGAVVDERVEDHEYGRFGWASDPEGNRFELWEPNEVGQPPLPSDEDPVERLVAERRATRPARGGHESRPTRLADPYAGTKALDEIRGEG